VEAEVVISGGEGDGETTQLEAVIQCGGGMMTGGEDDKSCLLRSEPHPRLNTPRVEVMEGCFELEEVALFEVSSGHSVGGEGVGTNSPIICKE
jgi:hypothetical protein